ncbi:MAG: ATP phosphoribosyltransferase regulatory subunit [Pseudomonadota bacterium]|nr:ATP phosphoribosyltransferase regulatory subunit [Pseudomonadota bacterium]
MNTKANRWLLPDGVDEILPPRANQLETLRRDILDLYRSRGYDLIKTPLIEFLDSLLIVPSHELQLRTCKIVDQLSGKSMGVRADISSQAARIDAHVLQQDGTMRLCYADSVLLARPKGQLGSRSPQLIGAELYGHSGVESDVEVITLLLKTLEIAGIEAPLLALGHSNITRTLLKATELDDETAEKLFTALQNKATADISQILARTNIPAPLRDCLTRLPTLHGDIAVVREAATLFGKVDPEIGVALDQLLAIAAGVQRAFPAQALYFDLCELRGYDYHTGVIFSAYVAGHGEAIANGGRYDGLGAVFGRARPATGFDADLKTLLNLGRRQYPEDGKVFAPAGSDASLLAAIADLRAQGRRVVQAFSDSKEGPAELACSEQLVKDGSGWKLAKA